MVTKKLKTKITVRRIYDKPDKADGYRVLVDRLWPRGISKSEAQLDVWVKELTPSGPLRSWFHLDREKRYPVFATKYQQELVAQKAVGRELIKAHPHLTLLTAAKDIEHSHLPTLVKFLTGLS